MEKLLIIGINTRSMLNSALDLDYDIYSTSYFSTADMHHVENQKIILKENEGESCGIFEDSYSGNLLLDISRDFIDEADFIIPVSGISPSDFSKKNQKKILGNRNVENIENKYDFYKDIKDEFLTPMTFKVKGIDEALEINETYADIQFILKPLQGSGGYDVNLIDDDANIEFNGNEFIIQEYVEGINLSSSVLSNQHEAKTLTNTRLLTMNDFGNENSFIYMGNILPLTGKSIISKVKDINSLNLEMEKTSERLSEKFNLVGSNGVDYIYNENGLYVIEINPRIQGTFECVEKAFGINMLEAHIMACRGEIIEIPKAKCYSYKKIIYAQNRVKYRPLDLDNIYDMPHTGSITEKEEPLLTIIDEDESFENLYKKVELTSKIVNEELKKTLQDEE